MNTRVLYLGDIVGAVGVRAVCDMVPRLIDRYRLHAVVANCENAADGFGITPALAAQLFESGIDVLTGGNHSWDRKEILSYIDGEPRLLRPLNYPAQTPGRGSTLVTGRDGKTLLVLNVMGRLYMDPLDDPFAAIDRALGEAPRSAIANAVLVDVHAEATGEKAALAHYLDGRVGAVVGSHTHVPTADARILPGGTAFISDAGMCGDYASVVGMDIEEAVYRLTHKMNRARPKPASGPATVCGALCAFADDGSAVAIHPLRAGGVLSAFFPPEL